MTQAFNLALLANNVNSSGQLNADVGLYNTVNIANGGTNLSDTPTNGQLLIGNGTGYTLATLTAGSGLSLTNGAGSITLSAPAAGGTQGQRFTSSGTFTIPSGVTSVKVTVVGGGGGGSSTSTTNAAFYGKGGGAGGTAIKYLTGLTSGNTLAVTIGGAGAASTSGGTSSVASGTQSISTISATGGVGSAAVPGGAFTDGNLGGVGSGGDFNIAGGGGPAGSNFVTGCSTYFWGGNGGAVGQSGTPRLAAGAGAMIKLPAAVGLYGGLGGLGFASSSTQRGAGTAATGYGNGGGGAVKDGGTTNYAGGVGTAGVVIFEW